MQASLSSSPPDFDFNLPCRYFKSSFARSLSMHGGGVGMADANEMQCKSLDFDIGPYRKITTFHNNTNNSNNHNIGNKNRSNSNISIDTIKLECPPLPQRRQPTKIGTTTTTATMSTTVKNEAANNASYSNNNIAHFESDSSDDDVVEEDAKPPALPARCPIVAKSKSAGALNMQLRQQQQQQQQQQLLAQFRHVAIAENANASGNAVAGVGVGVGVTATAAAAHGNFNRPINHSTQQQKQQHLNASCGNANNINNNNNNNNNNNDALCGTRVGRSRCSLGNRRNVWPTDRDALQQPQQQQLQQPQQQQQQQQQGDHLLFDVEDDDMNDEDDDSTAAIPAPPVAATRSTLTPHYAAHNNANATIMPSAVARTTPSSVEQRLPAFKAHSDNSATTANVQAVLLQNQVDTLQWQLKQVETSNEMYRAVIEEVARFLDRYQTQKQQQRQLQQQQQISRSKSLYQVYDGSSNCEGHEQSIYGVGVGAFGDKSPATSSCLRTRSTSNLIVDLKQSAIQNGNAKTGSANAERATLATAAADKRSYDAINTSSNNSYATFKDFTWRRSPKKCAEAKAQAAADDVEEKLNQEAFRLSRTIQNLLNTSTRQPDLTQHRSALAVARCNGVSGKLTKAPPPSPSNPTNPTSAPTLITPAQCDSYKKHIVTDVAKNCSNGRAIPSANSLATAEMLFLRANNIRDSRLSLRSSTDSSVHSTTSNSSAVSSSSSSAASNSSSKVETDEDATLHHPFHPMTLPYKQLQHPLSSATEDESGFSSISSFQDIGVPLCSTMISNGTSTPNRLSLASIKFDTASLLTVNGPVADVGDIEANEFGANSRNSTLKAHHPSNVLGVPLQATHDMQHRWDTTTKTSYRSANKYQRFSTLSNEDAAAVLWV